MPGTKLNIGEIRQDYMLAALDEQITGSDPLAFFKRWFAEALAAATAEVNAMTLATADENGMPHARIVLLKGIEHNGFTFYTNYNSDKGRQMAAQPQVALVFFWKELERQVRIEGTVAQIPAAESDDYFHSRPQESRVGAWASPQSTIIPSREMLDEQFVKYTQEFAQQEIPRPPHWGGYRVMPQRIEFWQGRISRMHDRIVFCKGDNGLWLRSRLAP